MRKEQVVAYEAAHEPACACEACSVPSIEERLSSLEKKLDAREAAGASEYVVRDRPLVGRIVFGPSRDLEKAKAEAGRLGSVVEWVPSLVPMVEAAEPDCARGHPPEVPTTPCAPDAAQEHVSYADRQRLPARAFALPARRGLLLTDKAGNIDEGHVKAAAARLSMMRRERHVTRAEHEEALRRIRSAGRKIGVQVAESGDCPGWYGQMEDAAAPVYAGALRWHRSETGSYVAAAGEAGDVKVKKRAPDRRKGVLPWYAIVQKTEVVQGESRAAVQKLLEKHLRKPATTVDTAAAEVAIVERTPDTAPGGQRCASPKDVHRLLHERYGRLGHEVFEVILVNINEEVVGLPVQVASGQASGVVVEVEQIMTVVVKGREMGATGYFVAHPHPGGTLHPSPQDRDLTKRIRAASKVCAPNMAFKGHVIVTKKGYATA